MKGGAPSRSGLLRSDVTSQFVWYLLVGGLSFLADLLAFGFVLRLGGSVMVALTIGFVIGTAANYGLSRLLAFDGGRFRRRSEIARLFAVALVGLGLTALAVAILLNLGASPMVSKIIATMAVFGWNFVGRRYLVFRPQMPVRTWRISAYAIGGLRDAFRPAGGSLRD